MFIGDSNDVSRVVGIDVDREKIKIFTLMGFLAAVAAIMLTLENKNFFGNQGQGYLLTAIASVLIGGTSIFGGRRRSSAPSLAASSSAWSRPGLVATGLTGAWVRTVQGLIFLIAIIFYLYVDEPQRRTAFFARPHSFRGFRRRQSRRVAPSGPATRKGPKPLGRNDHARIQTLTYRRRRRCGDGGRRPASAADPIGKGLVMYMQMGGNPGDGATLARQTGASQAAEAFGVQLKAQFSAWAPETMINQFKEAMAAKPSCIEIMGHPGGVAFHDLVNRRPTKASSSPTATRR